MAKIGAPKRIIEVEPEPAPVKPPVRESKPEPKTPVKR